RRMSEALGLRIRGERSPMSTQGGREVVMPAIPMTTSMRLRRWAARRARQLLRVSLALAIGVVLVVVGAWISRAAGLGGLPDIGDPWDVAAASDVKGPGRQDAFVVFWQAAARLSRQPDLPRPVALAGPGVGWSKADPRLREWVEANREVLELFKRAAAQPDGIAHPRGDETAFPMERVHLGPFIWLAV